MITFVLEATRNLLKTLHLKPDDAIFTTDERIATQQLML